MMASLALRRTVAIVTLVTTGALLQGCATRQQPDPYESWNRKVFAFNEVVDENVMQPVARGYVAITPEPVRTGVRNFFNNLRDVWSTANLFLQGRFGEGATAIMRVSVNTTLGLAGLIDIATPMRLDRPNEDIGQTLGVWGVGPGAYIVWPLLGPSTIRDSFDIPPTVAFTGSSFAQGWAAEWAVAGVNFISLRAQLLDAGGLIDDIALDKYAFMRDAYLQRRHSLVYNGEPPEEDEEEPFIDESGEGDGEGEASPVEAPGASESAPPHAQVWIEPERVMATRPLLSVADPEWALFPSWGPDEGAGIVNGREFAAAGQSKLPFAR